ncbi:hypothetical protein HOU03_gp229 [Caulobacter phage CcrSC]|uniref:Uncharacterized protein n=1 Tax=Caulobacter phage CcrSC TaxID=2283272 RepID=A0A385EGU8_9CAUD|nr:hypothetical protein HOU03_gp229 [Caulobacter phage CcrSC]AXQ70039.1 hypothetical protein CcrSC_gp457 [Caulobacter phage CcrSC]
MAAGLATALAPAIAQAYPLTDPTKLIDSFLIDRVTSGDLAFQPKTPAMLSLARNMTSRLFMEPVDTTSYRLSDWGVQRGHFLLVDRLFDPSKGGAKKLIRDVYALSKEHHRDPAGRRFVPVTGGRDRDLIARMQSRDRAPGGIVTTTLTRAQAQQNDWRMAFLRAGRLRPSGYLHTSDILLLEPTAAFPKLTRVA